MYPFCNLINIHFLIKLSVLEQLVLTLLCHESSHCQGVLVVLIVFSALSYSHDITCQCTCGELLVNVPVMLGISDNKSKSDFCPA